MRWIAALSPLWADMAETTLLDDGNLATSETSSDSASVGPSGTCLTRALSAPLTAESRYATEQDISSWRARGSLSITLTQTQAFCAPDPSEDPPPTGGMATVTIQYWDGSIWQDIDSASLTVPALVYATTQNLSFDTGTLSAVQGACRYRLVLDYAYTWTGSNNTISIVATLSEWTMALTSTGTQCSGGGVPDPDIDANCIFTQDAATSCTYGEDATTSCTYSEDTP